jgi:nocardicin N-oxygenase
MGDAAYRLPIRQDTIRARDIEADFAELRRSGRLVRAEFPFGGEGWIATTYDDLKAVLGDERFSVAEAARRGDHARIRANEGGPGMRPSFPVMDPPEHSAHRAVLTKHLTVRRVQALKPDTERMIRESLDAVERSGSPADFVAGFARLVPVRVICDLLGIPIEESPRFLEIAYPIANATITDVEEGRRKLAELDAYFSELVQRRRRDPGDDLISALLHDTETGEVWSPEELNGVGMLLLLAGHDATASILGGILHWLAHDRATFERLKAAPEAIPRAFDEFVRVLPAGLAGTKSRIALEDVQVGAVTVRAGEVVLPIVHSANYDERVFAEPDRLDLFRSNETPHVAFGFGPHGCAGQQLARMEIGAAVRAVVERYRRFDAADAGSDWRSTILLRGPAVLDVRWTR